MAGYDASIRVNTNVDNSDLKATERDIIRLTKQLDRVRERSEKVVSLGGSKKQLEGLGYDAEKLEDKLYEAYAKYEQLTSVVSNSKTGFEQAGKSAKKFGSIIQTETKKSNGMLKTLGSRLKGIALSLLIFNWITKGFNAMVSAMKSGFQNLAKYSKDYNASMSALKSECAQLKNGLVAAFEPIANAVIPYITQFISWINKATDAFARFLAAMSGKSTYTKAKKQVIDYAKALDTASKSAKGALAPFDSINVLTQDTATGGAGGESTGADAFEEAEVGTGMQTLVDTLTPFKESIDDWLNNLDFEPLLTSFDKLKQACEPIEGTILDGLKFFLDKVLLPLGSWTIEDLLPAFFYLLSAALGAFNAIWVIVQPYLAWLWDNFLGPAMSWVGDAIINGINFITDALTRFSDWATANKENMDLVSSIVLGFLAGIVFYYTTKKVVDIIGKIKKAFEIFGIISGTAGGTIFLAAVAIGVLAAGIIYLAQNWNQLSGAQKAITILGALAAAAIACAVAVAIFHTSWSVGVAAATIVGGLALLGLTAACLNWNGQTTTSTTIPSEATEFYNSTSTSPLPALATGGITTRPTTALIGEAGREAVLPLENNTGWMDDLANKIAVRSGGGTAPVYLQVDGKTFARLMGPYTRNENKRIGLNFRTT